MANFTLQDAFGSALGVMVFAAVLYAPGYVVAQTLNLFGFRRMGAAHRSAWAVALSFGVAPLAGYLLGKYAGLNAACFVMVAATVACVVMLWLRRGDAGFSTCERWMVALGVLGWFAFVFLSLADIQVGQRLYFSVAQFDQSYRVAFTGSVLRTGVPPANPLYFAGQAQPMRYYYFWYVVCAMTARLGHISARQAFLASSVWCGFGLVATIGLFVRHFVGILDNARRQAMITVGLLAVTGADLLPAIGSIFGQTALNGEMEWWSVDQFASWQDSLLWVPHHTAALVCCMLSFLLVWKMREELSAVAIVLAALAFASAFGLSIYVAFGFALMMVAWCLRSVIRDAKRWSVLRNAALAGAVACVLLASFLHELVDTTSRTDSGATAQASRVLELSVRRMIDPELLTGLAALAPLKRAHPVLLDTVMRLLLLAPGLVLELGFYAAVLVLLWRARRNWRQEEAEARSLALYLTAVGLLIVLFIRSAVIGNNDFGYRAALLPQFFLLLLAGDMLASWWTVGRPSIVVPTRWRRRTVLALLCLGVAGTVYQGVMLRFFLPLEERRPETGFSRLPAEVFDARTALSRWQTMAAANAVIEFNPTDPRPGTRGDVVSPYTFYARALMMNAGRQILSAEGKCAAEFGGNPGPCAAIEQATARLYAQPVPSANWAQDYCRRFGVQYLVASELDPGWGAANGWMTTLPARASAPSLRIVQCASDAGVTSR